MLPISFDYSKEQYTAITEASEKYCRSFLIDADAGEKLYSVYERINTEVQCDLAVIEAQNIINAR